MVSTGFIKSRAALQFDADGHSPKVQRRRSVTKKRCGETGMSRRMESSPFNERGWENCQRLSCSQPPDLYLAFTERADRLEKSRG